MITWYNDFMLFNTIAWLVNKWSEDTTLQLGGYIIINTHANKSLPARLNKRDFSYI
jgi:hypothetical protein